MILLENFYVHIKRENLLRSSDTCLSTTGEAQAMLSARLYSLAVVFVLWYFSRANNDGENEFSDFPFLPSLTNVQCLWPVEVDCYMNGNFFLPESETGFVCPLFACHMGGNCLGLEDSFLELHSVLRFPKWLHSVAVPYKYMGLCVGKGRKQWRTDFILP